MSVLVVVLCSVALYVIIGAGVTFVGVKASKTIGNPNTSIITVGTGYSKNESLTAAWIWTLGWPVLLIMLVLYSIVWFPMKLLKPISNLYTKKLGAS